MHHNQLFDQAVTCFLSNIDSDAQYNMQIIRRFIYDIVRSGISVINNKMSNRAPKNPNHEAMMLKVIQHFNGVGFLDEAVIRIVAIKVRDHLGISDSFQCSAGWYDGFKARNGLKMKMLCGDSASVDLNIFKDEIEDTRAIVSTYHPNDVFNMDETALFWRATLSATVTIQKKLFGRKDSKERVTLH
ncbi:hypothetical protein GEMRC1_013755 [Eukaryota sp. GEM-RC1]